jgi:hypothetical protein
MLIKIKLKCNETCQNTIFINCMVPELIFMSLLFFIGSLYIDFLYSLASSDFLVRDGIYDQDMVTNTYSFLVCKLFATMCQWDTPSTLCVHLW